MRINPYDQIHLNTFLNKYGRDIQRIYENVIREAAAMGVTLEIDPTKPFSFKQFPQTNARVKRLFDKFEKQLQTYIENGIKAQWQLSNEKTNSLLTSYFAGITLTDAEKQRYFTNNLQARDAFIKRTQNGMNLSDRVWELSKQLQLELELGIGISQGKSAAEMARELKQYLNQPDKLFRRVRDEYGDLQLSKAAQAYHPGAGVYRSSYKNALRLARTETNIAYRTNDHLRVQSMDFVLGIRISLSNNHTCINPKTRQPEPFHDICDDVQGDYPKEFKFTGWHPNCRCVMTTILMPQDEFIAMMKAKREGKPYEIKGIVKDVPEGFKKWMQDNSERVDGARQRNTLPYFIRDNESLLVRKIGYGVTNENIINETLKNKDEFTKLSNNIAKKANANVTETNVKSRERIFEKAFNDEGGDVSRIKDIIRNTFITDEKNIENVALKIKKQCNVVSDIVQNTDMGYSGRKLNIEFKNGTFAEIQINTPQMIFAKEKNAQMILGDRLFYEIQQKTELKHGIGHKYYEDFRKLSIQQQNSEIGEFLKKLSIDYYNAIKNIKI